MTDPVIENINITDPRVEEFLIEGILLPCLAVPGILGN